MAKNVRKLFAMLLTVCMVMSLLSIGASADEGGESVPEGNFSCGKEIHVHNANCYTLTAEDCAIQKDLACTEHTEHGEDCYTTHVHEDACYTVTPASENWTCTETAAEHVHVEGTCYTVIPESKTRTCELSTDPQLVCEIKLHVHTDACFVEHSHVDSCYVTKQICELDEHPAHTAACLSETGKGKVDAVIQQMTDAPELEDMQKARSTTYGFYHKTYNPGGEFNGTVEDAAKAYNDYITACEANRKAALQAYEDMPAELKPFVPQTLVEKLTNELPTDFKPKSVSVPRSEDEYNFMSVYQPCYEMSSHMVSADGGVHNDIPQTLLLVDTTADDCDIDEPYVSGVSNYEVMYCCDAETGYDGGIYYKRMNLEDSPYYNEEAAKHIRAIVMNSYPYVTLEEMEAKLPAQFEGLTRAEAIAAVQTAIWSYANGMTGYRYSQTFDVAKNAHKWGTNIHDYSNEMYDWWYVGYRTFYVDRNDKGTGAGDRIDALVNYLTSLTPVDPAKNAVVITSMEVVGDPAPVFGSNGEYEVLLKVVLNSGGSDAKDTLMLTATAGSSGSAVTAEVNEGQTVYYMLVSAKSGDTISVELSGTQKLPRGVYFYEAKPVLDDEGNVITAARDVSQNLVGVAMGDIPISFTRSKLFTSDLKLTDTAELQVQKVSESGNPLTGAEFTLYVDVDGDSVMDPAKTYAVNEQGYVVDETGALGIANLIPGTVYELKETKVPEGYVGVEGAARFEVVMVGEEAVVRMTTLPHGMAYTPNAEEILVLRVTNTVPSTGGGGGGGGGGSIIIPGGNEIEEIEEGDVPLTELPEGEMEIPEEDVPLASLPDEEVPLAMAPATGDASVIWMALSALSGAGLFLTRKKREDEE